MTRPKYVPGAELDDGFKEVWARIEKRAWELKQRDDRKRFEHLHRGVIRMLERQKGSFSE